MSEAYPEQPVRKINPLLQSYIDAGNYTAAEILEQELLDAGEE